MEAGFNRRLDVKQMLMIKEEAPDDQSSCADLGDLKHQNMKKEQDEVCISQGGELLFGKEIDANRFPVTATTIKIEDDEQCLRVPHLCPDQIKGTEIPKDNKGESIKIEDHGDDSNFLETERVEDDEEYKVKHPPSVMKHLSDYGLKIVVVDCDWNESRDPESDRNLKQFIHDHPLQKNMTHSGFSISKNNKQRLTEKNNVDLQKKDHTEAKFECVDCGKTFIRKQALKVHQRIHTGLKPFSCDLCKKAFSDKSRLNRHMTVHTGQKPFCCDLCNKRFSRKAYINEHMRIHTGQKPFFCNLCHKAYSDKSNLIAHIKAHAGLKPFCCDLCGKRFTLKSGLHIHMTIHTGHKPYCCDVCGQRFGYKSCLKAHMTIHTGEKPFSCDVCNKTFSRKPHLKRHMAKHSRENLV